MNESFQEERTLPWPARLTEPPLLLLAGLFIFVNFLALSLATEAGQISHWSHFLVWLLTAFVGHRLLERYLPDRDPLIYPLAIFLTGWGLLLIDRLAPAFADRQTLWLILGVAAMLLIAILPHTLRWLRSYRYILLMIGLLLLVSTIVLGRNPSGLLGAPQLWLSIGSIFVQPSEILKIVLVVFLASYLAEQYPALRTEELRSKTRGPGFSPRILGPILLMWFVSIVILVWQRDLGTAILFFMIFLILLYMASGSLFILLSGVTLITLAAFTAYQLFAVVQLRIDVWLNPWPEADNRAYQIVQSLMAFSAGGIFGSGIAQGRPDFVPVVHSDFIFAALGEEWGLLGVIVLLAVFATLVVRGLRTAVKQQSNPFYTLMAVGLSTLIATQSIMIMGGVLKVLPLTGVTLPFMSYGGSSLLVSYIMIGLLLRLSAIKNPAQ